MESLGVEGLPMLVISKTEEHEDGSVTLHFDLDDKAENAMVKLGVEFAVYCAAHQMDIQDALDLISREGKLKQNQSEEAT